MLDNRYIICAALALHLTLIHADSIPYQECFTKASVQYGVPEPLLIAVAKVESKFDPKATHYNTNKSFDMGIMQVNSTWLKQLETYGITKEKLLQPCQNIMVGAWIMAQKINAYGFTWAAIQRYNGSDPKLGYAQKVFDTIRVQNPQLINNDKIIFNTEPTGKPSLPQIVVDSSNSSPPLSKSRLFVSTDINTNASQPKSKFVYHSIDNN
jgi:hypothetical protein